MLSLPFWWQDMASAAPSAVCAGSARPALCSPVGYRAAGRRQHGGGAGAAGQCGVVLFGVQHPGGGRQRLFGPGGAGLRPKVVCQPQRAGNGCQRCGYGAFRCVFNRFCGFCGKPLGDACLFCRARCGGAGGVRGIRRRAAKSTPARRPAKRKSGKRPAAPPDGAHHAVPPVCCGGGAGSPAHAAVQPGDSDHCSGPRPAGAVGALVRGSGQCGQRSRAVALPRCQ